MIFNPVTIPYYLIYYAVFYRKISPKKNTISSCIKYFNNIIYYLQKKETAKVQPLLPEVVKQITIDSVNNHNGDTTYQYEYRTGESEDYQYNYDVIATYVDGNELKGNINVEEKCGKETITDLEGNKIEITTEWIGYGKLLGIDDDGNEYEILVKN